jgi:hypothetical protein
MSSIFTVTTAAPDLTLLDITELRAAVGITNDAQDTALMALGAQVAARIASVCDVADDGVRPPTLRQETLTETFRSHYRWPGFGYSPRPHHEGENLILRRRPIVSVFAITEDGVALDPATDYEIVAPKGMLRRLTGRAGVKMPWWWFAAEIIVVYDAGYPVVRDDLKRAASLLALTYWRAQSRDPAVRQINIPGVIERQFFSPPAGAPDIPLEVRNILSEGNYLNREVG